MFLRPRFCFRRTSTRAAIGRARGGGYIQGHASVCGTGRARRVSLTGSFSPGPSLAGALGVQQSLGCCVSSE